MNQIKLSSRDVAFMAVFAALSAIVCRFIPGIPIVGVPEASIKFDAALAPIYGLVIGPYLGFLAALFGGLIVAGSFFSVLTSFCTAVSALVAGLLVREKCSFRGYTVNGWVLAALVLGLLILGWYGTWVGQQAPLYPVLHLFGLFIILTFRGRIATYFKGDKGDIANEGRWVVKPYYVMPGILVMFSAYIISKPYWLDLGWTDFLPYLSLPLYFLGGIAIVYGIFGGGEGKRKVAFAIGLSSYCGIIADHMLGNLIFIGVINIIIPLEIIQEYFLEPLGLPSIPSLFMYMIPVSAVERFLITAIATIFGIGLILALYRGGLLSQDGRKYK